MTSICPDCSETFASPSDMASHYNGNRSCSDPRVDLRWRVDDEGRWTVKSAFRATHPELGCYDDTQHVEYGE